MTTERDLHRYTRNILRDHARAVVSVWDQAETGKLDWQDEFPSRLAAATEQAAVAIWELVGPMADTWASSSEREGLRAQIQHVLEKQSERTGTIWGDFEQGHIHTREEYDAQLDEDIVIADTQMWAVLGPIVRQWSA